MLQEFDNYNLDKDSSYYPSDHSEDTRNPSVELKEGPHNQLVEFLDQPVDIVVIADSNLAVTTGVDDTPKCNNNNNNNTYNNVSDVE